MDGGGRRDLQSRAQGAESLGRKRVGMKRTLMGRRVKRICDNAVLGSWPGFNVKCTPIN